MPTQDVRVLPLSERIDTSLRVMTLLRSDSICLRTYTLSLTEDETLLVLETLKQAKARITELECQLHGEVKPFHDDLNRLMDD